MIANNEIPPYTRLVGSMTDGTECLRSYTVLMESDRKRSTASLSLTERQRVSAPTARVAVNSRIKNVDRFCISQDSLRRSPGDWGRSRCRGGRECHFPSRSGAAHRRLPSFFLFSAANIASILQKQELRCLTTISGKKWISNVAGNKTAGPDRSRGKRSGCRS